MIFITSLIVLIIERFFHWNQLRHWKWFDRYQRILAKKIANWPSILILLISILPWMLIVGVIDCALTGWFYNTFKIVFNVMVLLYCLGPDNLWMQGFSSIHELHKADSHSAIEKAQSSFGIAAPESPQAFHRALTQAIFIAMNERVFAALIWFILLGPVGAVMYRAISLCAQQSELGLTQLASKIQGLLDWLPVRLLTFLFALGGHFNNVFAIWRKEAVSKPKENDTLLIDCGIAALALRDGEHLPEDGSAEKGALELFDRSLVISLVILAAIVLLF